MWKLRLALSAVLALAALAVFAYAFSLNLSIRNVGSVQTAGANINVYWDAMCSRRVTEIAWGTLVPGENRTVTVYVRNEGDSLVRLSYATENWQPSEASRFMALTWNYGGQWLAPGAVLAVNLCLSVSPNVQGVDSFSFDIVVSAWEFSGSS